MDFMTREFLEKLAIITIKYLVFLLIVKKHSDNNENLYQILSNISAIWAPVKYDEKYEEHIQRLIEIASLSGRPLIVPDGLNFSDIPFVFPFKDSKECAGLLD